MSGGAAAAAADGAFCRHVRFTAEYERLESHRHRAADWKLWGPYVSERAWASVREDYSESGDAWRYLTHDMARSKAYRWNEDGIAGWSNRFQNLVMHCALWNGRDAILKERLFGVTGSEGNHGEDVKELYYYEDSTPTHSYMSMLYRYPQDEFPYAALVHGNAARSRTDDELELADVLRDAFAAGRYFDVRIEYAKADCEDVCCRITATNRADAPAELHLLPHIFYRNTWSWGYERRVADVLTASDSSESGVLALRTRHRHLGERFWYATTPQRASCRRAQLLFCENNTNNERLYGTRNDTAHVKDGFHRRVVNGETDAVSDSLGSKACAWFHFDSVAPGQSVEVHVRFTAQARAAPFADFGDVLAARKADADDFYDAVHGTLDAEQRAVQRQAFAGLLWSKQFYHYSVEHWLTGDPAYPPPVRRHARNADWPHVYCLDVISMPDKWEYPWFAAWDLAFHCLPLAVVDPQFAKRQLTLMLREWYMHPNGQLAAYEWNFGDVNPPVHAWAALRVYQVASFVEGERDVRFLSRVFHKLLLNFTWWVNRKDATGRNVFQGGFLGLDNIGLFDRSQPLPAGYRLDQADGTAWMAMYCLNMLAIALELAEHDVSYEDVATKFFEHFVLIGKALNADGDTRLWCEESGFYFDHLHDGHERRPVPVFSFVGLIPLFGTEILRRATMQKLPNFMNRVAWFRRYRPHMLAGISSLEPNAAGDMILSCVPRHRLERVLQHMVDPDKFWSRFGLRSLSKHHAAPYFMHVAGEQYSIRYEPGHSPSPMFGGNSNWRGPVWFPVNYLMVEALQRMHEFYGDRLTVLCPQLSGADEPRRPYSLAGVAEELCRRLCGVFCRRAGQAVRACHGADALYARPGWAEHALFYEFFHGETGAGLGASHQTGWTALVANVLAKIGDRCRDVHI